LKLISEVAPHVLLHFGRNKIGKIFESVCRLAKYRVRTSPGKPGKSWNFNIRKSRPGNPGKSILVMEVMEN
jgi:hypothetical protein